MSQIISPTRFDLAGGTVDMWPLWAMMGGGVTINVSIDIQTYSTLEVLKTSQIHIESPDLNKSWTFQNLDELLSSEDPHLLFYQAHLMFWKPRYGFRLKTKSESPVGGGLGGSSSLSVSVFKSFMAQEQKKYSDLEIVTHCSNIEAFILKTPTGTQDYFPAVTAGLHIIDYALTGVQSTVLQTHQSHFNDHCMLVYTGKSHHSGINNWQVLKKFIDGDKITIRALEAIREIGHEMKTLCLDSAWGKIPALFDREFKARLHLAESFMSPEIEKLKSLSEKHGALGFKICGAGGGGCVVIWCDPKIRNHMEEMVTQNGFQVLKAKAV
ncbi:MAG: galactokinase [Bdellovibrionales bacterium]|nr:galactokinase [Bdellovibrionales bacterium]